MTAAFPNPVEAAQRKAEELLTGHEHLVDSGRVLHLVKESSCSAYDCELAALAERLRARLVTFDKQILRSLPELALTPDPFLEGDD